MTLVEEIMEDKVATLPETATVTEAAKKMADDNVGTVLVLDNKNRLAGLLTDRKITTEVTAKGKDSDSTTLVDVMTKEPDTAKANNGICDEVQHMKEKEVRRMPVVDDGDKLLGVLSIADVAKDHAKECERCSDAVLEITSKYA